VIEAYNDQFDIALKLKNGLLDGTATMEQFATGVAGLATAYAAATSQLAQTKKALDDLFGNSQDNFRQAGLSNEDKYQLYQSRAESDYARLLTATSVEQIDALARKIDAEQNAAFSLLTAEQQLSLKDQFIAASARVQSTVDERIGAAGSALDAQNAAIGKAIKDALAEHIATLAAAAATSKAAADTALDASGVIMTAAVTPQQVNVGVTVDIENNTAHAEVTGN
jgi:hypothetical protein